MSSSSVNFLQGRVKTLKSLTYKVLNEGVLWVATSHSTHPINSPVAHGEPRLIQPAVICFDPGPHSERSYLNLFLVFRFLGFQILLSILHHIAMPVIIN